MFKTKNHKTKTVVTKSETVKIKNGNTYFNSVSLLIEVSIFFFFGYLSNIEIFFAKIPFERNYVNTVCHTIIRVVIRIIRNASNAPL